MQPTTVLDNELRSLPTAHEAYKLDPTVSDGVMGTVDPSTYGRRASLDSNPLLRGVGTGLSNLSQTVHNNAVAQPLAYFGIPALAAGVASKKLGKSSNKGALLRAILAGMGGLGLMAWSNSSRNAPLPDPGLVKSNSFGSEGSLSVILEALANDPGLGTQEKATMADSLMRLPSYLLDNLASILAGAAGASAGDAIARFLLGNGLLGRAVGAASGGLLGASMFAPGGFDQVNALGQHRY